MDGLKFNNTVVNKSADTKGQKIETEAANESEKNKQDEVIDEINNFNEDLPDTSGDEPESEEEESKDDEESEEESDEEEDDESKDKEDDESDESEEEESDEESDEEGTEEDSRPEWEREGFKTAEEYISHLKEEKVTPPNEENLSEPEKQKQTIFSLIDSHKDILPESAKENYQKFFESGNNAFLHMDNHLHKLVVALDKINDKLPFKERVEAAFALAFRDKMDKISQKRGEIKAEIRTQKVNKSAGTATRASSGKSGGKVYAPDQLEIAKRMGVKLT